MFPKLTALLPTLALPGDWPAVLRGRAVTHGELDAYELALLVDRWTRETVAGREAERLKWGWGHPRAAPGVVEGEGLPPKTAGYWWVGTTPTGRPRMEWFGPGKAPPAWASLWTTPGLGHWVRLPARVVTVATAADVELAATLFEGEEA